MDINPGRLTRLNPNIKTIAQLLRQHPEQMEQQVIKYKHWKFLLDVHILIIYKPVTVNITVKLRLDSFIFLRR